jgi:hypothetical protein
MGIGSSNYPTSVDAISRIQDGVDYIEETDPNDAYATVEAVQTFIGASGASQAHNTTILRQIKSILPEIRLSYSSTTELSASSGSVICSNGAGTIIKLRANTIATTITPSLSSNTQYYVYAVADATATTVTFESGTSATTAPSATTYRRIGRFKTNASSHIMEDTVLSDADNNLNIEKQTIAAWIKFDGTGTPAIDESFNVTSITDNGTGNYTINLGITMADANYIAICQSINENSTSGAGHVKTQTTTSVNVLSTTMDGSGADHDFIRLIVIGEVA